MKDGEGATFALLNNLGFPTIDGIGAVGKAFNRKSTPHTVVGVIWRGLVGNVNLMLRKFGFRNLAPVRVVSCSGSHVLGHCA